MTVSISCFLCKTHLYENKTFWRETHPQGPQHYTNFTKYCEANILYPNYTFCTIMSRLPLRIIHAGDKI